MEKGGGVSDTGADLVDEEKGGGGHIGANLVDGEGAGVGGRERYRGGPGR